MHFELEPRGARVPAPWPVPPAGMPFLYLWLAWAWWSETLAQLTAVPDPLPVAGPGWLAGAALAARALAVLTESACYVLWWRGLGERLRFWRFTAWVATLSGADLLRFAVGRAVDGAGDGPRMFAAVLAGPAALAAPHAPASGAAAVFGGLGLLTVARIVLTAWAQGRGLARRLTAPLLLTSAAWLGTRLVAWWSLDLLQGRSPLP